METQAFLLLFDVLLVTLAVSCWTHSSDSCLFFWKEKSERYNSFFVLECAIECEVRLSSLERIYAVHCNYGSKTVFGVLDSRCAALTLLMHCRTQCVLSTVNRGLVVAYSGAIMIVLDWNRYYLYESKHFIYTPWFEWEELITDCFLNTHWNKVG